MSFDASVIRKDFPVLQRYINDKPLVYLDSANTSQKPQSVIDAMTRFLEHDYAPTNRSAYQIAAHATDLYESARTTAQRFINAPKAHELVFTKNATEALNLIVRAWGEKFLRTGDIVVLTHMEHHANIVPWHMLVEKIGIQLRWIPLTSDGQLDLSNLDSLLDGAKVLSFTAMSNVLGTITPVKQLCDAAHRAGAIAIVDGCQSVPHMPTDVIEMGADFLAFSSHKLCGPTGLGILYGREELLDAMDPFIGGGNMISDVRLDGFTCADLPAKFEAGTQATTEAIGFAAALQYLNTVGMSAIRDHETELTAYAIDALTSRFGDDIVIHGSRDTSVRGATISFAYKDLHPHDVSQILDESNVCVRAGHHCAKPLMRLLGAAATVRASFYLYNTPADVDALCDALEQAGDFFTF